MCDWLSLMNDQQAKDLELFGSQMHPYIADVHRSFFEVDTQLRKLNPWDGLFRVRAPQCGANTSEQLSDGKRFNDVIVGSRIECGDLVTLRVADRHHNDGPVKRQSNLVASLKPTHARHVHIQENKLGAFCDDHFDRLLPTLRFYDLVAITGKSRPEDASDLRLIIYDKNGGDMHQ